MMNKDSARSCLVYKANIGLLNSLHNYDKDRAVTPQAVILFTAYYV